MQTAERLALIEHRIQQIEDRLKEHARKRSQIWLVMIPTFVASMVALITRYF